MRSDHGRAFQPTAVKVLDIAEPLTDADLRVDGAYGVAHVYLLSRHVPFRSIVVDVEGGRVQLPSPASLRGEHAIPSWVGELPDDGDLPFVSVIVPTTFDRVDQLERCVTALATLDYPDFEVIVVDNRPGRPAALGEKSRLERIPRVRVVAAWTQGSSAARNAGSAAARAAILAFTDDDARPLKHWLRSLVVPLLRHPSIACVTGLVLPAELDTEAQYFYEASGNAMHQSFSPYLYRSKWKGGRRGRFRAKDRFLVERVRADGVDVHSLYQAGGYGIGSNFAVRADVFRGLGGLDEKLGAGTPVRGGEDVTFFIKLLFLGHQLRFEPSAIVQHADRRTIAELRDQIYGYGLGFTAGLLMLARRDPNHLLGFLRILVPGTLAALNITSDKVARRPTDFPDEVARAERRGMVSGPLVMTGVLLRGCVGARRPSQPGTFTSVAERHGRV